MPERSKKTDNHWREKRYSAKWPKVNNSREKRNAFLMGRSKSENLALENVSSRFWAMNRQREKRARANQVNN